jgi:adenylate cyclase
VHEDVEAALDNDAPDVGARRAVAEQLLDLGFPVADVVEVVQAEDLERAANMHLLFPGPHLSAEEFAARVGLTIDQIEQVRRASGLSTEVHYAENVFSPDDAPAFEAFAAGVALFGEEPTLQFIRVMGSALSQVAEAAVAVFAAQIAGPMKGHEIPEEVQFKVGVLATQALAGVGAGLQTMFRFHAETAIRRLTQARLGTDSPDSGHFAVGFIDLVGFTPLSAQVGPRELRELFDEFEGLAFEVIAQQDARLVKLIGDALMFTALDPNAACDIALTLVEHFSDDRNPVTPRGAIAFGEMLVRGGDYYGPVVNLAARAADLAVPYEVLVSEDLARSINDDYVVVPAGRRHLKGFAEPVTLATLTRATASQSTPKAE